MFARCSSLKPLPPVNSAVRRWVRSDNQERTFDTL
jgi:hypothetical protein